MRSRETKVKVHNQWLETDREKHPSAQRTVRSFHSCHDSLSCTVEQITDRRFYVRHPRVPRRELCSLDVTRGRFTGTVALLAHALAVGHHSDLCGLYGSWLLDYKQCSFNRPAVLDDTHPSHRVPVRQIRSRCHTRQHTHIRQWRIFLLYRLFSQQRVRLLSRIHDRSPPRGGSALSRPRGSGISRSTPGFR